MTNHHGFLNVNSEWETNKKSQTKITLLNYQS